MSLNHWLLVFNLHHDLLSLVRLLKVLRHHPEELGRKLLVASLNPHLLGGVEQLQHS
jgi:hypothetical protein